MLRISLLHATYFSTVSPTEQKEIWLTRARHPKRVEYVVAMEITDRNAIESTSSEKRCINTPIDDFSTSVQNWNSAAQISQGDILFVISDDLKPLPDWDIDIEATIGSIEPTKVDFALKVQDSPFLSDSTLRHPLISRNFYTKFGLFNSDFRGVFCDNDITLRALLYSRILDGRATKFDHKHPHFDSGVKPSISQDRINRPEEYAFGRRAWDKNYAPFHVGLNLNRLCLPTDSKALGLTLKIRRSLIGAKHWVNRPAVSAKRGR